MPDVPCYRIPNWNKRFETADTRKIRRLSWVPMPNNHDTAGYARVLAAPRGLEVYAAWALLVQVASKMPERGTLANENGPLTADDLALRTRVTSPGIFSHALAILSDPLIGWLEMTVVHVLPGDFPGAPGDSGTCQEIFHVEGKGREGNRREEKSASALLPTAGADRPAKKPRSEKQAERDGLWDALAARFFPSGVGPSDRSRLGKAVTNLKAKGATPESIETHIANYHRTFPDCAITLEAIMKHWDGAATAKPDIEPWLAEAMRKEDAERAGKVGR